MMRPGVTAGYASEAYEVIRRDQSWRIIAPTRPIRHRGDTLQGPNLTIDLSTPAPDVVRVKIVHFAGGRDLGPHFEIAESAGYQPTLEESEKTISLRSGCLNVEVDRATCGLTFSGDGRFLTSAPARATGYVQVEAKGAFVHEQLTLAVGENVYGLGERFTAFVKNGQTVELWNQDGGTDCEQAYKNIPFYLTNAGYGVFVNEPGPVSFEVATEKVSRVQFSIPGESLDYFLIYGPTPREILEKYTALTGRPALPPAWSFGLWLTTSFTTNYDEETVTSFIQGMADRDLPLHVFHFDCFWMRGFHWTDLEWDPVVFPDPKAMLARLKAKGLRICAWINSYIAQASSMFEEGAEGGYLLKRPNGDVWQWDMWQPGMGIVDFTNPEAREWYGGKLRDLIASGVDALKTDFGERIPTDVAYHDGSDPVRMHNYYPQLYNQVAFDALESVLGKGEAVLFARSATAGGQKFPVHWGGDCWSEFSAMAESLRGGLSLCLSGFGFWSHDIGGFEGLPPASLYKRWVAFGLLSSHSRLHGSSTYRVPWLYDDEAVDTLRFFTKLKCRLMPYLYQAAVQAHRTGIPMMRAMMLEFPEDPACLTLDRQYMLGDSLLVAPVFSFDDTVEYYVPAGSWTRLLDGSTVDGPGWHKEQHGFLSLPILVRPNSVVVTGAVDDKPDYQFEDRPTIEIYGLLDGGSARAEIVDVRGSSVGHVTVARSGAEIRVSVPEPVNGWRISVPGFVLEESGLSQFEPPGGSLAQVVHLQP